MMEEAEIVHEADDDEDPARVFAMCEEMLEAFDDYDATTLEAMRALATVASTIIVHHPTTRETAMELRDLLARLVAGAVQCAEDNGLAVWARGTIQ